MPEFKQNDYVWWWQRIKGSPRSAKYYGWIRRVSEDGELAEIVRPMGEVVTRPTKRLSKEIQPRQGPRVAPKL